MDKKKKYTAVNRLLNEVHADLVAFAKAINEASKIKILRKWCVLDARIDPMASIYHIAVLKNEAGQVSMMRILPKINASIPYVQPGMLNEKEVLKFAEEHLAYLEGNYCFVKEVLP